MPAVAEARRPTRAESVDQRTSHLLGTDPGGCWVAEDGRRLVGFAMSFRRDLMWCWRRTPCGPASRGRASAGRCSRRRWPTRAGCLRGMFASSSDPKAFRVYRRAGFTLHPQMYLTGVPDRSVIPVVEKVREGRPATST